MIAEPQIVTLRVNRFARWMPQLIAAVAAIGGIEAEAVERGFERERWAGKLRAATVIAAADEMGRSWAGIGRALGDRHYATIISIYRYGQKRMRRDDEFRSLVWQARLAARAIAGRAPRDMTASDIGLREVRP